MKKKKITLKGITNYISWVLIIFSIIAGASGGIAFGAAKNNYIIGASLSGLLCITVIGNIIILLMFKTLTKYLKEKE